MMPLMPGVTNSDVVQQPILLNTLENPLLQVDKPTEGGQRRIGRIGNELLHTHPDQPPQDQAVKGGPRSDLHFHGHAGNEHRPEDEKEQDPLQAALVFAYIQDLQKEKYEAGNQGHDQRRAEDDDQVVGQGLAGFGGGH